LSGKLASFRHGSGPCIVFAHAFPLNSSMWKEQVEALSDEFLILTYDLPGFGESPPPAGEFTMRDCADDLAALLDEHGVIRAVIAGCSLGGYIALSFMAGHRNRAAGYILADTRAGADAPEQRANRHALADEVLLRGMDPVVEAFLPKLLGASTRAGGSDLMERVEAMMRKTAPAGGAAMLRAMAGRPESFELMEKCLAPVCIIVGEEEELTPPPESVKMSQSAPCSEYHMVKGAGHLPNLENPDAFNAIVRDFCRRVRGD